MPTCRLLLAVLTLFLVLSALPSWAATVVVLAENGTSDYRILIDDPAPESVREAATELQRLVHLATGARLPIVHTVKGASPAIRLGAAAVAAGLSIDGVARDGFRMHVQGRDLRIAGPDEDVDAAASGPSGEVGPGTALQFDNLRRWHRSLGAGTWNGVIEFARRTLQARWYFPGPMGEVVGDIPVLQISADLDETMEPRFFMRRFAFTDYDERRAQAALAGTDTTYDLEHVRQSARWGRRLRHTNPIVLGNGHGWRLWIPADQISAPWIAEAIDLPLYGEDHPEYFALVGGARQRRYTSNHQHGGQLCVANPDLRQTYVDNIVRMAQVNPGTRMFSLAQNDGGQHCECDLCQAWDPPGAGFEGGDVESAYLTDRLVRFQNDVARRVREQVPDAQFTAIAYHATGRAPLEQQVDPSIHVLGYYNYLPYRYHLQAKRTELEEALRGWGQKADTYYFSTFYFAYGNYSLPWSSVDTQRWVIEQMVDNDLLGFNGYYGGGHSTPPLPQTGPDMWLLSQLLWDPDQSIDELVDEWYSGSFGPAAGPVRACFDLIDSTMAAEIRRFPDFWASRGYTQRQINLNVYPAVRSQCAQNIADAQSAVAAESEAMRWRVDQVARTWQLVEYTLDALDATRQSRLSADAGALEQALEIGRKRQAFVDDPANRYAFSAAGVRVSQDHTPLDILTELPAGDLPSLSVPLAANAPTIDGKLDDAAWTHGAVVAQMRNNDTFDGAPVGTQVTVLAGADGIYLRALCDEPEMAQQVVYDKDGEVWRGDVFEVYLAPSGGAGGYYQFLVNAHGTGATLAHRGDTGMDRNWRPQWQRAGGVTQGGWGVELFVPWNSLDLAGPPQVGDAWRAGLYRERYTGERANFGWSPTGGLFAQPHLFGRLVFAM